jgi:hypothetical protein
MRKKDPLESLATRIISARNVIADLFAQQILGGRRLSLYTSIWFTFFCKLMQISFHCSPVSNLGPFQFFSPILEKDFFF